MEKDSNLDQALGVEISIARKNVGMSQEKLAEKADIHRTFVSQIERGTKSLTMRTLFKLSGPLNVSPSKLIQKVEERLDGKRS